MPKTNRKATAGFTLVELLVVIAIIGVLVALLLPAIQAARESARRTQCTNQLRQLAIAFQNHHDTHRHLPTGGWGFMWLGYPEYGFGKEQPGGWMYNILPFVEQAALHDYGRGTTGAARNQATKFRVESPFEGMNCPSRRSTNVYEFDTAASAFSYTDPFEKCNKTDYAACAGDMIQPEAFNPPPANTPYNDALTKTDWDGSDGSGYGYNWRSAYPFKYGVAGENGVATGVVFGRSEINFRQIQDGTVHTYMVGEKYMSTDSYDTGLDAGDNEPAFSGNNADTLRTTSHIRELNRALDLGPDQPGDSQNIGERMFGSAHPGGFNMAMCDASVKVVSFDIDKETHRARGHRSDGVIEAGD
jgi:prepilin-type N-terminal cleavage/methylation domain-containing protein/prepilin-type processing-associated H-X9-DG protein